MFIIITALLVDFRKLINFICSQRSRGWPNRTTGYFTCVSRPLLRITEFYPKKISFFRFAYKIHVYEEYRQFCLMHVKKMEWFSKLSNEDKSHKAVMAKNKYKVGLLDTKETILINLSSEIHQIQHKLHEGTAYKNS